jgi:diguanylate cyclase (GGDEF)-like protein
MIALRNASIRAKLFAGLGLALLLIVLVGGAGLYNLQTLNRSAGQIVTIWLPRVELLGEIKAEMAEYGLLARSLRNEGALGPHVHVSDRIQSISQKLQRDWRLYEAIPGDAEEALLYSVLRNVWGEYEADLARTLPAVGGDHAALQQDTSEAANFALLDHAMRRIDDLITYSSRQSTAGAQQVDSTFLTAFWLTIAAIVIAVFGVVVAIYWVGRDVSAPIRRVSQAMRRLNEGDESATVAEDSGRRDEIGALVDAVNGYRESLVNGRALAAAVEQDRQRFLSAINNMPIGLVMFDAEQKLIVANARYSEIYRLPSDLAKPGTPFMAILEHRISAGQNPGSDGRKYVTYLTDIVKRGEPFSDIVQFHDGRIVSLVYQPMEGGGWVSTHEDITDRRKAEAKIAHMAHHDGLTDLPNRVLLRERIEDALVRVGRNGHVAILCLDLDHFKDINDTLGHTIGDALLTTVARRLAAVVREGDTVARLGGDEFAIIQVGAEQPKGARALAERVIEAVGQPCLVEGHQIVTNVSIGVALAPSDGTDAAHLLKAGDMALYRAKSDGRGIYRFFERGMDAQMQERRSLEIDLRKAIKAEQFELFYQPQFNLETNAISGFEALIRWLHPARGLISPLEFVPIAEEAGLIVPIGEWVLKRACDDAAKWPSPIRVAVNLSPVQFRSAHLMQSVIAALAGSGLAASRLELEITESVLLADSEATLTTLHHLRAMGVRISMDDFGTGYSSLSYLQSFPFDKIKIDRRFITDVNTDESSLAIIRAVTGMCTSLGITTTAEGVETREQFDRVRAEGCDEVQGFLTGRPMLLKDALALMQRPGTKVSAA